MGQRCNLISITLALMTELVFPECPITFELAADVDSIISDVESH